MAARAISSGTISFGLVSIPIKLYTAASSAGIAFNFLHNRCGSRMKQQQLCPVCDEVVQRSDLVRGYEFAKNQYVRFENDELKTLEEETSKVIELEEFVPLEKVDPVYFEKTYYLGPDKGGDKAYRLLADAMTESNRVGVAKYVMRGKEGLVLIRAVQGGLMLHTMYYADEVRDFDDIEPGADRQAQGRRAGPGHPPHRRAGEQGVPSGELSRRVQGPGPPAGGAEGGRQGGDGAGASGSPEPSSGPHGGPQGQPGAARRRGKGQGPARGQVCCRERAGRRDEPRSRGEPRSRVELRSKGEPSKQS